MGASLIERIQAKIELFRLEQRYTRRRHRRSTFVSNAIYVDGEYIYNTPNTTGSSSYTNTTTGSPVAEASSPSSKRWSSMPGFGSLSKASGGPVVTTTNVSTGQQDWRPGKRASFYGR